MPSLSFQHIVMDYPDEQGSAIRALDGFSLEVAPHSAVALIGPSGCGKSTLLRIACGLQQPTAGSFALDGAAVDKPRRKTALIPQDYGLLPWKTVYHNAELGLRIAGMDLQTRRQRTQRALAQVGLAGFERLYPRQLSGGMKQRLALARALAMDVDLLLMDEPLSALDALLREEIQDALLALWQERQHTQILITHSIEEAVFLGQTIVVLTPRPGRVAAVIDNPAMGSPDYRSAQAFQQTCVAVRSVLAEAGGGR